MPSVVRTARWTAAQRARESERPDRLFFNPLASMLAGPEWMAALQLSEKYNPRHDDTANYIALRTRFFDDIAQSSARGGIRQVVLTLPAWMRARLSPLLGRRHHPTMKSTTPNCSPPKRKSYGSKTERLSVIE